MSKFIRSVAAMTVVLFIICASALVAQEAIADKAVEAASEAVAKPAPPAAIYYAMALSVGCGCLAAGFAVAKIGSAVMGAAAENPDIMGKAIAFAGVGEGIALFGFLIAIFLYSKL